MNMNNNQADFSLISDFKEISLERVEQELFALWSRAKPQNITDNFDLMRSCAFNLIVILPEDDNVETIIQLIGKVTTRHPARVVFITINKQSATDNLKSSITASCNTASNSSGMKVCHEIIRVQAQGKDCEQIDNVALSLSIPDIPTFLWWNSKLPDTLQEEKVFANLVNYCERLIFDSEKIVDVHYDLSCLACLMPFKDETIDEIRPTALGDLTWQRLLPWRLLLAKKFDSRNTWQSLNDITKVTIEYGTLPKTTLDLPVQVSLILGWLATSIGWKFSDNNFVSHNGFVDVDLKSKELSDSSQEVLQGITLEMPNESAFVRLVDNKTISNGFYSASYKPLDLAVAFERELNILGRNKVYEDALKMAAYFSHCRQGALKTILPILPLAPLPGSARSST